MKTLYILNYKYFLNKLILNIIINLKKFLKIIGIDKAISFTLFSQIFVVLKSFIAIYLIAKYFTTIEQGFYYTFSSLLAIQVLFELGFSSIITQFVAHEKSKLEWVGTNLIGNEISLSRISSLLKFTLKWFFVMSIILLIVLTIVGFIFFTKYSTIEYSVNWKGPWCLLTLSTSFNLFFSSILFYYEGLGKVEKVAKLKFFNVVITSIFFIILILFKTNLYAFAISNFLYFIIILIWFNYSEAKDILYKILHISKIPETFSWKKEILPYQTKIAMSWVSGYLIFQLFNPVIFSTFGPQLAGQMGLTQAVINGIFGLTNSWMLTKVTIFSMHIAKKEYQILNYKFINTLKQSLFIMVLSFIIMFVLLYLLKHSKYSAFENRFLPITSTIFLSISTIIIYINNSIATYLRCHKEEPFLYNSLLSAFLNLLLLYITAKLKNINYMTFGFLLVMLIALIHGLFIFRRKKIEWHNHE